jgi:hypothetical protein
MAISTLPLVLLKTHVYMMAKQVVARTNTTTLNAVSSFQGVAGCGVLPAFVLSCWMKRGSLVWEKGLFLDVDPRVGEV